VGKAQACPPFVPRIETLGMAQTRLCPPYAPLSQ
jgi:hypothetical protein